MSIDQNDPKWTAYVLGELTDAQRSAVDELLAHSPDAARLIDDIRRTAGMLTAALADDVPALHRPSPVVASRVADGATSRAWLIGLASFAACALLAGGVLLPGFKPNRSESLLAKKEADREKAVESLGIKVQNYHSRIQRGDTVAVVTSPATSNDTSEGLVPSRGVVIVSDGREIAYTGTKPTYEKTPLDKSSTVGNPVNETRARLSVRGLARLKERRNFIFIDDL